MTIKDIAKKTGYAVSTVSRALNGKSNVSEKAKKEILAVINDTGFIPNNAARTLKTHSSKNILILVKGVNNYFFEGVVEKLQAAFSSERYSTQIHYLDEDANETLIALQLQREVKPLGFVFLGANYELLKARFNTIKVPTVVATTVFDTDGFLNLSCVGVDDIQAGYMACEYLVKNGHNKIAVIGGNLSLSYMSTQRYAGFCKCYSKKFSKEHPDELYMKSSFNMMSGYKAMNKLLESGENFTSVFCMSDICAVGAMRAAYEKSLKMPKDISIIGFDGIELSKFCVPKLTTIKQPQSQIAIECAKQMLSAIETGKAQKNMFIKCEIEEGESVKNFNL